jgi:hypothetical protein
MLFLIIGTETWLNNTIYSSEIIPTDQYDVYRNDRDNSRGGRVLIAVRKTLISSEIFKSNDTELLAVKIHHKLM